MGLFRSGHFLWMTASKIIKSSFLIGLAIILIASHAQSINIKQHFFRNAVDLLTNQTKKQLLITNTGFDFKSRNSTENIKNNNNTLPVEDCFNEIDDDGDGLVDCYDDDCAGVGSCDSFHIQYSTLPNCQFVPPTIDEFKIEKIYQTDHLNFPIDQRSGIVVGDMDGDGVPEIISKDPNPGRIQIYSGVDGTNKQSIVIPTNHPFSQPAIADVDRNGKGDIFVMVNNNQLRRYEYGNTAVVWETANNIGDISAHSSPQVADFDQDGRPEVYVGNRIFDAITGTRYAIGTGSTGKASTSTNNNHDKFPIAFDVFQQGDNKPGGGTFGAEADGLELIAGNQVYTYTPEDNTPADNTQDQGALDVVSEISGGAFLDGFTSFADVDGDSQVDIVVMAAGKIYVWNPRTQTQIGTTYDIPGTNTGGRINVGDFDNDGMVEIGTAGKSRYVVLEYDAGSDALVVKWEKTGLDDGSQRTGSTLFDFEGDGINEVVYSEEAHLYIWKGTDGSELVKIPAQAGTRTEYPLVADVNDDGAAEIIITAQNGNGPGFSGQDYVQVYRSMNTPWVTARKVWNQHGYFVTNINEDLTVPIEQQNPLNPALNNAYNGFLVQTTILNANSGGAATPAFAAPDAAITEIDSITLENCPDLMVHLTIKNEGSDDLPATTPIAFYDQDPSTNPATLLGTSTIGMVLNPANETSISVRLTIAPLVAPITVFAVINDPGTVARPYSFGNFPISGVGECDFNNNLAQLTSPTCIEICDDEIDNDSDGIIDEPNIMATTTQGCSGTVLPMFTTDEAGGTWEVISSIGTTISATGIVTLGTNHSPTPAIDTIVYISALCNDTLLVRTFDDETPKVACPGDQNLMVNNNCQVAIPDYTGMATANDNCSDVANITLMQSPASGDLLSVGLTTVTITAIDEAGNSSNCTFQLRITDAIDPVISCPSDTTLFVDNSCDLALPDFTNLATISDNCSAPGSIMVSQNPAIGTTVSGDNTTHVVTLTAKDENGNTSSCDFTVTLQDTLPPSIICPSDITINLDANCQTSLLDYTNMAIVSDNCADKIPILVTQSPKAGEVLMGHGNTQLVTLYANDGKGNIDSCHFMITLKDNTPPSLTCPMDQSLTVDTDCEIIIPDYTGLVTKNDNCAPTNVTLTQSPVVGTTIGVLDTVVKITITATDNNGNTTDCSFLLTLKDEIVPTITCPANVVVPLDANCKATLVDYTGMATVEDNCTPMTDLTITQDPAAGKIITSTGTTMVTLTVKDKSGNEADCSFAVSFVDTTDPILACPADETIGVDGDCAFVLPDYRSTATYSDNCTADGGLIITQDPLAGDMISGDGTTQLVTIKVEDESGNFTECTFTITLADTTPPSITCPINQDVYADSNCDLLIPDFTGDATVSSECATGNAITLTQSPPVDSLLSGHGTTQIITLTATDGRGNSAQCNFVITVIDTIKPSIICPADSTIYTNANCKNTIPDLLPVLSFLDNCADNTALSITQSPAAGTTVSGDSTSYTVTFTVNDGNGNQSECAMTVELIDTTAPVITCLPDQIILANTSCQDTVLDYLSTIIITDDCETANELIITQNPVAGTPLAGYNNTETITITATDSSGNSSQCIFQVTLKDEIAPTITCPADLTLNADINCEANIGDYTNAAITADICAPLGGITVTQSPAAGTLLSGYNDTEIITLTANDGNGNTASCTFTITLKDTISPTLICPTNQSIAVNSTCEITIPDYTSMVNKADDCLADESVLLTQKPAAGTIIGVLDSIVKITIIGDDMHGNVDSCSFNLTLKDEIDPTITCPANMTVALDGNCEAVLADYTSIATIADNCTDMGDLMITQSPVIGTTISAPRVTTITLTVTDESGNTANCTFEVTFEDATNPSLTCPADETLSVDGDCAIALPNYITSATFSDNCTMNNLTVTQTPAAGTMISGDGTSQNVVIKVTDESGNTSQCDFTVTLEDTTAPSIACPSNQNIYADNNCQVSIADYTTVAIVASDCNAGNGIKLTQDPVAGTLISGHGTTHTITLTATDSFNNASQCTFVLTILDTIPTIITCPSDSTTYADAACNNTIPNLLPVLTIENNCPATGNLTIIQSPAAGTNISGDSTNYTVIFTVNDGNGNQSQCSMTVELIDTTAPIINCLVNQTVFADANCQNIVPNYITAAAITDNCAAGNDLTISQSPLAGTVLIGHNDTEIITITATDNSGNSSECTFELVLKDTLAPSITCPADIILHTDANCQAVIEDYRGQAVVAGNCTASASETIMVTQIPAAGDILTGDGTTQTIKLIAKDGNGNSDSCTFLITLEDVTPPNLTCPENQVLTVDTNCEITIPDYRSMVTKSDNCASDVSITLTQRPAGGTTIGVLDTIVLITIIGDDNKGNLDSCSFFVSLKDEIAPTIDCPNDLTISLDGNCEANLADYTNVIIDDNCTMMGDLVVTQSPIATTLINSVGTTTVTLTVTDESGNNSQCTFSVTFEDTTNPTLICPPNDTLGVDGTCAISLPDYRGNASFADNCTNKDYLIANQIQNPAPGTMISGDGYDQLVMITVTDESGNMAQCDFMVALRDITIPSISCPGNQTIYADNDCQVLIADYTNEAIISSNCSSGSTITVTQEPLPNTQLMGHGTTQIITLTATDGTGNTNQCTFEVIVADTILPQIICPADTTIYADINCGNTIPNLIPALTYENNCPTTTTVTTIQSPAAGTIISGDSTNYTVTFTVNDGNGNQSQCAMTVELIDTTSPTIICLTDQIKYADAACNNTVPNYIPDLTITDNCAIGNELTISQDPIAGTPLFGHNDSETITITAVDNSGNSSECSFVVVLKDTLAPTINCPSDIVLNADANCQASIGDYTENVTVSDNCTATTAITITQKPAAGEILSGDGDTKTITFIADDGNGNLDSCTILISLEDVTPPTLSCPTDQSLTVDMNCEITIPDYRNMVTKTDNCLADEDVLLTQNPAVGTTIGVLDTMVKITIIGDDTHGNIDSCTFFVTLKDEILPTIDCPAKDTLALDANCQATIPDYTSMATIADNCTPDTDLTITQSPTAGQLVNTTGNVLITLRVKDGSGNTNACSFEIHFKDIIQPTITCPENDTLSIDGDCPIALPDYTGDATFTDNCSGTNTSISQDPIAGTMISGNSFNQTVTLTVTDESGNTEQCSFIVTLKDSTPPTISCPADKNVYADAACDLSIPDYTGEGITNSDCATGNAIKITQDPVAGTIISGHNTSQIITLTATDSFNNINQCAFIITVLDTINPQITCPSDSTIYADASCENTIPNLLPVLGFEDNCAASSSMTATQSPTAGTIIEGDSTNYTVTFTVKDGNGNESQCSMTVELIDTIAPAIICITNQIQYANATCEDTVLNYIPYLTITDNCVPIAIGSDEISIVQNPIAGTALLGQNDSETITIIATDNSGNSTQCSFVVVLKDTIPPSIACPANIVLDADGDCEVPIGDYTSLVTVLDNCTADSVISVTQNPAAGTLLAGHGDIKTITLTANDGNGNSSTCSFTISLKDITPPVLICPANQVLAVDDNCEITVPDYTSMVIKTDNCLTDSTVILTQKPAAGTIIGVLDSMVKITIIGDDTYGNIDSCDFILTLKDEIAPQITCPENIAVSLDDNCQAIIADYTSMATIMDNCTATNDLEITQSPAVGTLINSPTVTRITLVVKDGSGNTSDCTFVVDFKDTTSPSLTCPRDTTLSVDGNCSIALADYTQTAIFDDNCSINSKLTVMQDPVAGTMISRDDVAQVVTITVVDESGNSSDCSLTVYLEDITPPALTCHSNQTLYANGDCEIAIPDYTSPMITSACATGNEITVGQIPPAGMFISGHQTIQPVTLTAKDKSGNVSQCVFNITVLDTINPQIICPRDTTIYTDSNCGNIIPNLLSVLSYEDNCPEIGMRTATQFPLAGKTIAGDSTSYTVTFTVDDGNGNQSQCAMMVELIDTTAPVITCPIDQIVYADASCQNVVLNYIPDLLITDNCAAPNEITISQSPAAGTVLLGHNDSKTITMTVTDNSGNTTQCFFEVILKDTINPTISCPVNQQVAADADCVVTLADYTSMATVADNCNTSTITVNQFPAAGTMLSGLAASRTITLIADDGNGNIDSCHFDIELIDETLPTFDCLSNQIIYLDQACSQTLPDFRDFISPMDNCSDNSNLTVTQFPAPDSIFSGHSTEIAITLEVTDESGNTQNCRFTVLLQDTIAPSITCPIAKIVALDGDCEFELPDYRPEIITVDNCRGTDDIILLQDPIPGTIISKHNTEITITFTADDENGNTSTCDLLLTVKDSINPIINCPPDISLSVDAACERILPDYTMSVMVNDNCPSETGITITQSPLAGTILSDSRTVQTVKLYANDGNGNIDSCDFNITLTDTIPPSITCPEIQNIYMDANCEMSMPDYTGMVTYTDNCITSGVVITQKPIAGTLLSGSNTIINTIVFATDFDGNMDSCVFQVILKDTLKPIVACLPNQNVYVDSTCFFEVGNYAKLITITDNCTVDAGIEILQFPPEGIRFTGVGSTHTITLAVIDETGNETQCHFDITLLDTIAPVISCPDTQFVDVDGICEIVIPDYTDALTVADNCTPDDMVMVTQSPTGDILSGDGTIQEVMLSATDESGNVSTCSFIIKLVDRTKPAVSCPGDQDLNVDANCMATIPDYSDKLVVTNDCDAIAGITITQNPPAGTVMLTGLGSEQLVTLTASDINGNADACTFKVTLIDTIAPVITCLAVDSLYLDACFSEIPDYNGLVTATDNCSTMDNISISQSMAVGVIIIEKHAGVRLIQIYAEDEAGNVATCEFPIIFIDTFPPFIACPVDTIAFMDDGCELIVPDYTNFVLPLDNCADLADVTVSQDPIPGTVLHDSDTTYVVTLTADDSNGNQSFCTFNLTLKDTIAPIIICPSDQVVAVDENCQTSVPDFSNLLAITDNCSNMDEVTIVQTPPMGTVLLDANTDTTITFVVTDKEGNTSTCSFNYLQTDQTAPLLTCPEDRILSVDDDCPIAMPDFRSMATISDNCSDANKLTITQSPAVDTMISGHGTSILITISATDEYNNTATCTFTLSLQDTIAPMLTCPTKQTLLINDNCEVALPDYRPLATAINSCNSAYPISIKQIPAAGTIISGIGTIDTISIIATDSQGNADTCKFKVYLIFDLPPLITRTGVKVGERMEICIDHPCLVGSNIKAYDKSGSGIGIGAGGTFEVNPSTGCLTYALKETPSTDQDSFCVIICDVNNFCDTINYRLEIDGYQAFIVDPCVCLNNESSFKSGDGQFFEYAQITAPSGDNWQVVTATGFYSNPAGGIMQPDKGGIPYPLNLITKGTATIEVPRGTGLSDYYLAGLHIDEIGYAISFSNTRDTLHISNSCTYDASCRQIGITSGEDGLPPDVPSCSIEIGNGTIPALTTLESCQPCQFKSNNIEHLYEDDSVRNVIHTICATDQWKQLKINFTQFELAAGDTLYVYDGKTIVDSLLGKFSGTGVSQTGGWVASSCLPSLNSSGCLTFQFKTNGDYNKGIGWQSEATCVEKSLVLNPPNDLVAKLTCSETYAVFDILPATITSNCGAIQDSQIVRVLNQHGVICLDTCLAMTDVIRDTFAIGAYVVQYKLKSDTVKTAQAMVTVQGANLVCNDEINVPLGSSCAIVLTPDDLLESTCDTITDTLYYFIKLKGIDKNGNVIVLAEGGGKGGNYPMITKDMINQCGGSITAEIEKRYYEDLNLSICNNGVKSVSCAVKINIIDQSPPIFQNVTSKDTFRLCSIDLTAAALGIPTPTAIDNCDSVKVEFAGATLLNDGGACDTTRALLNWTATDACGNIATLAQSVVIVRPDMTDIVQAPDVVLSCGEDEETALNDLTKTGMPRIKVGKVVNGILVPTDTIALDTANYVCGYILQKRDVEVPSDCGIKVFRYWDVLDWCDTQKGIQPLDTQFIELRDTLAPKFVATALPTLNLNLPHDACTVDITKLAAPIATDNCSTPAVLMTQVFRMEDGAKWEISMAELTALNADSFEVNWVASDDCHVQTKADTITQLVIIEDNSKPVAICTNKINLSLGQVAAQLHYREIDGGSTDACGIAKYEVSRDEINWDSIVSFTCEDAHRETKVYLRITDANGNNNTCWMTVNVEDKIAPICSDLPTMTGICDEGSIGSGLAATDINDNDEMDDSEWSNLTDEQANEFNAKYGHPNCSDNVTCGDLVIQQQYQLIEKICGMGTIKRRFRAVDWDGEGMTSNWSTQTINIETKADWAITLPADWKGTCGEMVPNSELIIKNGHCDLMGYEVEERAYSPSWAGGEDACLKVVRTFTIINWCKYEAGGETKTITRVENEHGIVKEGVTITSEGYENVGKLEYVQILKLEDNTAPIITINPVNDCVATNNCLAEKTFSITATDCNDQSTATLKYSWQLYQFQTEVLIAEGTGASFNRTVSPSDRFVVKWEVADNCGNIGTATANHYFVDCQKPVPYCLNGVGVELSKSGTVQIWASDIDAGSYDNCSKEDLQIKIWHESLGEAPTHIASILALPENITFDCGYLDNQEVSLYVIDRANNWDYCTSYVNVQDNMGGCENTTIGMAIVSGTIMDWKVQTVEEAQVAVSNSSSMLTKADGHYDFELAMNNGYTIKPSKDDQPLNGVSTFDLALMAKHILGIQAFENPYQMIAADVNGSGTITAFDMVQIRQLILNITTEFPNSSSWKFVYAGYEFTTENPTSEMYPQVATIADLQQDMEMDFVAIKMGDVNGNARPSSLVTSTNRTTDKVFEITTEEKALKAGEKYTVTFNTDQLGSVEGYQFTLGYDDLKVEKLKSGVVGVENFGLHKMNKGMITTSWNQSSVGNSQLAVGSNSQQDANSQPATRNSQQLFTIEFIAEKGGKLSEQLNILSRPTAMEAYDENGDLMEIQLTFTTPLSTDEFDLFQNQPNPFPNETEIGFYLPGDSEIELILRDETGRILKTIKEDRPAGYNTIQLNEKELMNGFIYYQLSTKFGIKAKKMLKLN